MWKRNDHLADHFVAVGKKLTPPLRALEQIYGVQLHLHAAKRLGSDELWVQIHGTTVQILLLSVGLQNAVAPRPAQLTETESAELFEGLGWRPPPRPPPRVPGALGVRSETIVGGAAGGSITRGRAPGRIWPSSRATAASKSPSD